MGEKILHFLITFCTINSLLVKNSNCVPQVRLRNSLIYGETVQFEEYEVNQYLSMPYAEPPVGELRFKKTVPLYYFPQEFKAINVPPACHQYREDPYPTYINSSHKSEDCLYLNIWTPVDASARNRKAVMFWIHGGSFRFDSIQNSLYSGVALAAFGDIIVVTVNYRLGLFGYFTSGTEDAPGNAGLWDVLEGLKWVNRNIAYFGGDPTRITIMGESAGSEVVGYLSVSPLAEGLYSRQVMQSGAPVSLETEKTSQNLVLAQEIAKEVKCANDTFTITDHPRFVTTCLKRLDVEVLVKAEFRLKPISPSSFLPQFGDKFLPENPTKAVFKGNFRCKELFIGDDQDEGSLGLVLSHPEIFGFFGKKNPQINQTFGAHLVEEKFKDQPDLKRYIQQNLFTNVSQNAYSFIRHQVYTILGDLLILCPDEYYAKKCAEKGGDVYFYFFVHRPSTSPWAKWMGVAHFDEVQFVFGQPYIHPELYHAEKLISKEMIRLWSNFVKTGKPDRAWPLYSEADPVFKYLGRENGGSKSGRGPHEHNCEIFRPFFEQISKNESNHC